MLMTFPPGGNGADPYAGPDSEAAPNSIPIESCRPFCLPLATEVNLFGTRHCWRGLLWHPLAGGHAMGPDFGGTSLVDRVATHLERLCQRRLGHAHLGLITIGR